MMLHGYCTECHRIRPVQVSGPGMARIAAHQAPIGVCRSCQDEEDERRQQRRNTKR